MSDFDKEAERKRLREKYEQEESDRETTARMSELLLKGATMTNAHCGTCGDPIFRYEGQEFCPTCQEVVTEGDVESDASSQADPAADGTIPGAEREIDEREDAEPAAESAANTVPADEPAADARPADEREESVESEPSDLPETRERAPVPDRDRQSAEPPRRPEPPARREETDSHTAEPSSASRDLAEARASLERTLVRFARHAEDAEDPRRARENLEAAREAAETLAALSEVR